MAKKKLNNLMMAMMEKSIVDKKKDKGTKEMKVETKEAKKAVKKKKAMPWSSQNKTTKKGC
jgi:hypothetical protein